MPRLNPAFLNSVFFLYTEDPRSVPKARPEGTGFLVSYRREEWEVGPIPHIYAVTCRHVAPTPASFIRINTKDGVSRVISTEPGEWQFFKDSDDIAIIDITDYLDPADDYVCFETGLLVDEKFIKGVQLGPGEDGFMLGLFANHPGVNRNLIAARFGNLSRLAIADDPVKQGNRRKRPSHLFDMRSRTGFSGSPVFVYRTPSGDLRDEAIHRRRTAGHRIYELAQQEMVGDDRKAQYERENWIAEIDNGRNNFLRLLGMHSGQFREPLKVTKPSASENASAIRLGDKIEIPSSMTVVVPAWRIKDLLEIEWFRQRRKDREMRDDKDDPQDVQPESTGAAASSSPTPASEAEPDHQEAFNRLVATAATAKPKDDRT